MRASRLSSVGLLVAACAALGAAGRSERPAHVTCGKRPSPSAAPAAEPAARVDDAAAAPTVAGGGLPPEVIQRVVRQGFGGFRRCYEAGLRDCPNLNGRVVVSFVIRPDGTVAKAWDGGSDLVDRGVVSCVVAAFRALRFPAFEGPPIRVSYPIAFTPGE